MMPDYCLGFTWLLALMSGSGLRFAYCERGRGGALGVVLVYRLSGRGVRALYTGEKLYGTCILVAACILAGDDVVSVCAGDLFGWARGGSGCVVGDRWVLARWDAPCIAGAASGERLVFRAEHPELSWGSVQL
jgi:hypothetical protein